jgi:PadR family transcriptional regulator, regulatory protein PadR
VARDDLVPGTLEMLILKALTLAPMHGYGLAQHLHSVSGDLLIVEEGSLYPALQRLRAKGLVSAAWRQTPNKRRARYYTITAAGERELGAEVASYQRMQLAIQRVLRST